MAALGLFRTPSGLIVAASAVLTGKRTLILAAKRLDKRPDRWESEMPLAQMDFDRIPVLR